MGEKLRTHLILTGSAMLYLSVMELLLSLSAESEIGALRTGLIAFTGLGAVILAIGRLTPARDH